MKEFITRILICPSCLPRESALHLTARECASGDVTEGELGCPLCGARYPISEGLADLSPAASLPNPALLSKYEDEAVLAPYLWSHFGEAAMEEECNTAYSQWASLLGKTSGLALDVGCAVGRMTFEMSVRSDFAIGIDRSTEFVRKARELMLKGGTHFEVPEEGRLSRNVEFRFPSDWDPARVEFLVADAQALPFSSGAFSEVSSLNLLDRLPNPLQHLMDASRVAAPERSGFLFSDPFSWSEEFSEEAEWLGGTKRGSYPGDGFHNVSRILQGDRGLISPPWRISATGAIWWALRNHRNHFERIRSRFIRAER